MHTRKDFLRSDKAEVYVYPFKCMSKHSSDVSESVSSGYQNAEKRVENTARSGVFLTKFEVFG